MEIPRQVASFRHAAYEYCVWSEAAAAAASDEAIKAIQLLAALVHHAVYLPGADPEDVVKLEPIDDTVRERIYARFAVLPFQHYFDVFHPTRRPPEDAIAGDIADDLLDVYVDLKEGLVYYDSGHPAHAVWHWRFTFGVHWGHHATSALRALHCHVTDPQRE